VEPQEVGNPAVSAVREAREEAGVIGRSGRSQESSIGQGRVGSNRYVQDQGSLVCQGGVRKHR
jgi:hypothetical protein